MRRYWAACAPKAQRENLGNNRAGPAVQKLAEAADAGHVEEVKAADPAGAEDWLRQLSAVIRPPQGPDGWKAADVPRFFLRAEEPLGLVSKERECEIQVAGRLASVSLAPDVGAFGAAARSAAAQGDAAEAMAWLSRGSDVPSELLAVEVLAKVAGAASAAQRLIDLEEAGERANLHTYTPLGLEFGTIGRKEGRKEGRKRKREKKEGRDDGAVRTLGPLWDPLMGAAHRHWLEQLQSRRLRPDEAAMMEAVLRVERLFHGAFLTSIRQVAAAAARRGDVAAAKAWLQEMTRRDIAPDEVAFTTILTACARASEADEANELLQSMRTSAQPPGAVSYTDSCYDDLSLDGAAERSLVAAHGTPPNALLL
ncbi:Pentatricopeptide repeat-containing protein [Symbiodinium microadriaticum]|uniref:Pentatricopeptide repeat-containing protein n=1 Tax=Symbiodinium microadriaticum TaxID=2951 RepID=A0A1Q9E2H5_SYMMI|nr:Pentatricopeptide repeat-containing protein [Symbiodinium microadriaticum]